MLERRIEVDEVRPSFGGGRWGFALQARIRVTTPEQEPALVTLRVQVRLQTRPAIPNDDLGDWLLRLVAERLSKIPPAPDPTDAD